MAIPGKENENGVYEFPYMIKPVQKTKWEAIKTAIWDPSTKAVFGRTGKSWAQILLFYTIFYIALTALFSICMAGLYATLNKDRPTYTADRSLIGTNPGLGFRPISEEGGALIWYSISNKTSQAKYIGLLNEFLKDYNISSPGQSKFAASCNFSEPITNVTTCHPNIANTEDNISRPGQSNVSASCNFTEPPFKKSDKACPVDITKFGNCNAPNYGYNTTSPCIFLKLNKIFDWVPETYDTFAKLPDEMPNHVKENIHLDMLQNKSDQVWVSCEGEYAADKEHAKTFEYYPTKGFPAFYYPFKHKKGEYLSPLVAVEIKNPKLGVLINVECRAWADNIKYSGGAPEQRKGSVRFEIMIDE